MGVLPAGSGNDYVKALGVGTDFGGRWRCSSGGRSASVDTAEVNGVPFNNGLGIGFDAEVAAGVAVAPAYLGGTGRYLWSVGRLLKDFRCHEARLSSAAKSSRPETILVAVAIGTTYGSMFRLAPEAVLDDGLFDVVWSEEVNRAEVLRLIPAALRGTLARRRKVHTARAREVEVELSEEVPAHVDGEMLAGTRHFRARVLPGTCESWHRSLSALSMHFSTPSSTACQPSAPRAASLTPAKLNLTAIEASLGRWSVYPCSC